MSSNGTRQDSRSATLIPIYFMLFLIVCLQTVNGGKCLGCQRKVDCRKFVHAPVCRGIAAKRDINPLIDDTRYGNSQRLMDSDYYNNDVEKLPQENVATMKNLLTEILKRNLIRSSDYDTNTGQIFTV